MGYQSTKVKYNGIPNKSRLHIEKREFQRYAPDRGIRRTRRLCPIKEESDLIAESDQKARGGFRSYEGELPTARRVHKELKACRQDERKGQGLSHVRPGRSGIKAHWRERMRNENAAERLNTTIEQGVFPPSLSQNFFMILIYCIVDD